MRRGGLSFLVLAVSVAVVVRIARGGPGRSGLEFAATAGVLGAVLWALGRQGACGGGGGLGKRLVERFVEVATFDRGLFTRLGDLPGAVGRRVTRGIENVMDAHVNESSNDASPDTEATFVQVTAETLEEPATLPAEAVKQRTLEYMPLDDLLARLKNVAPEAYARVLQDTPEKKDA
jgi:hypothetical protein